MMSSGRVSQRESDVRKTSPSLMSARVPTTMATSALINTAASARRFVRAQANACGNGAFPTRGRCNLAAPSCEQAFDHGWRLTEVVGRVDQFENLFA